MQKPAQMSHFDIAVKAHNDAHLALSSGPHDMAEMTEIVIGGQQNTKTWISISKMGEPVASRDTPGILSWDEFRSFWISWKNGVIQVLNSSVGWSESRFLKGLSTHRAVFPWCRRWEFHSYCLFLLRLLWSQQICFYHCYVLRTSVLNIFSDESLEGQACGTLLELPWIVLWVGKREALLHLQCTPELGGVPGCGSWNSMVSCPFQVGHGTRVLNESIIVEWTVPKQLEVKYIGFSTGWGSMGEFKIWRKEETDENHNEAFTLGVPHNIIPGSERATASIIGIKYQEVSLRYPLSNVNRCSSCYFWPVMHTS